MSRLLLYTKNEGPTVLHLKRGDIFGVRQNAWVPGEEEKKKFLIVEVEDMGEPYDSELEAWQYIPDGGTPLIVNRRKYFVVYWAKLSQEQIEDAENPSVAVEPLTDVFDLDDIHTK